MPKISVNIPCYNSSKFIRDTIESVLTQTYGDFEIIIIDDGSTDNTGDIIQGYNDRRIRYYFQENKGLSKARNRGLSLSGGEFIAFIDHDDLWIGNKLEKQIALFESKKDINFIYTNYYKKIEEKKRMFLGYRYKQPEGNVFGNFLGYYPVVMSTSMVRRSAIDNLNEYFDENLNLTEEYDLFMRLLYTSKAAYIVEPLVIYRVHSQMSSLKFIEKYPIEHEYILHKLKQIEPKLEEKYRKEISFLKAKINYWYARAYVTKGQMKKAKEYLAPYRFVNYKFFIFYLSTFFSPSIWKMIDYLGNKASIRFD
ncbi:MAG: glycosyltransferase [Syntrophorhabdaceae bacterium]|nr:glycosyltransferase [Syntrophorhabdaceae bacterium]